ncbi:MAG: hypothetical protein SGJ18_02005 [Pseudomonadota bacterium]|nr:hypothetical protein [Pseudomonadota bacterium]
MSEEIKVTYKLKMSDGKIRTYLIRLDETTLELIEEKSDTPPKWADLEHRKCDHCPLNSKDFPHCPVAKNLATIVDEYKQLKSFETCYVEVETSNRNYSKQITLQEVLYSIFGLIMPATKCPHLKFLRPMARFHLPFSSFQETMVRSTSFYLLGQYFVTRKGGKPDFELSKMDELYVNVQKVNEGILNRIRSIATGDADANSLTILNVFAQMLSMQLSDDLSEIQSFFES